MRIMSPIIILAALGLSAFGADVPQKTESIPDPPWLRDQLEAIRTKHHLPALAASMVVDGKIVAASAVGVRKWGATVKATRDDAFHLGSVAKPITATMIARLVEQRKIRWDTTLTEMFPELIATVSPWGALDGTLMVLTLLPTCY